MIRATLNHVFGGDNTDGGACTRETDWSRFNRWPTRSLYGTDFVTERHRRPCGQS
jgi:hypothetical protein